MNASSPIPRPDDSPEPAPAELRLSLDGLEYQYLATFEGGLGLYRQSDRYALSFDLPAGGYVVLQDIDAEEARRRVTRFAGTDPGPLSDWQPAGHGG